MSKSRHVVMLMLLIVTMSAAAKPLAAETVADCYEKILNMCAEALDGARWYEKPIIGAMCSAMLAGCTTTVVIGK